MEKIHDLALAHIFQFLSFTDIYNYLEANLHLKTILQLPKTRLLTKKVIREKRRRLFEIDGLCGHTDSVNCIAYSPDGSRIASGSADKTIRQWDVITGQPIGDPIQHTRTFDHIAYSPDGYRIVSSSCDAIQQWDIFSVSPIGQPIRNPPLALKPNERYHRRNIVFCVAYSPDGSHIISSSMDRILRQWDTVSGQPIDNPFLKRWSEEGQWVRSIAYSPDGSRIVLGSIDGTIRQWDVGSGQPIGKPLYHDSGGVLSVAYSSDGSRIISDSLNGTIQEWDAFSGQSIGDFWTIRQRDIGSGQLSIIPILGITNKVFCIAYNPDGFRIAYSNRMRVYQWDVHDPAPRTGSVVTEK